MYIYKYIYIFMCMYVYISHITLCNSRIHHAITQNHTLETRTGLLDALRMRARLR